MTPTLAELIAEGVLLALKGASGGLTKEDILGVIEEAMRQASRAEVLREFPGAK